MSMNNGRTDDFSPITSRCFVNAPYDRLRQGLLDQFIRHRLRPEIGLEGNCLWTTERQEFEALAAVLREQGLSCTLHAPFFDLAPGGLDLKIREASRQKLRRAFQLAGIFRPRAIVCHLGYEEYKHSYKFREWLTISTETWIEMLDIARGHAAPVMFENTYESKPDVHRMLFEQLQAFDPGFCLDVGHLTAYAGSTWETWLDALLPWLGQVHLHDNSGGRDEHRAVGTGVFPFQDFFAFLRQQRLSPLITLEPHSEPDLWLTLRNIAEMRLFEGLEPRLDDEKRA